MPPSHHQEEVVAHEEEAHKEEAHEEEAHEEEAQVEEATDTRAIQTLTMEEEAEETLAVIFASFLSFLQCCIPQRG